ncbi:arylacetamide deacetylase-like 4 [Macrotis lagotis]|uniref:arylacetamide deacetylase-like 4 n=1 Tax=Macrotis lagotis TaxID=92651 RepID=UPI003D6951CC
MPKFVRFVMKQIPVKKDPKIMVKNLYFGIVPVTLYKPKAMSASLRKGIIFFHGGGMIFGSPDDYNNFCCYLSKETDLVVLSVGYRLAPEHNAIVGVNDCTAASIHFLKILETYGVDPFHVILCGDSVGGTIVASVCQKFITQPDLPKIRAHVMIYPYLQGLNFQLPSYQQHKNVPFLSRDFSISCIFYSLDIHPSWKTAILNGAHLPPALREKYEKWMSVHNIPKSFKDRGYQYRSPDPFNEDAYQQNQHILWPVNSPLIADNDIIAQFPETLLVSCEFDVLRDDVLLYKKRLEDQGVPVSWHHIEDAFHGVLLTFGGKYFSFPSSLKIVNVVVHFIKNL